MATDLDVVEPSDLGLAPPEEAPPGPDRLTRVRSAATQLGVIGIFALPAVVLWWNAWSRGARSTVRCTCLDPGQQVWFIAWPAYALSHLLDPFATLWLWPPHGVNLLANASAPLAGLVLTPVTWLFGPFVATTVALTLAPALSAWGCWLACRRFVTWPPAAWVGGLLFGYSPFVVQSVAQGHLSTGLLVLPPLMLVVLHEITVRRQRSAMWCGVCLGALVVSQFLISPEVLVMVVLVAIGGLAVAAALSPRRAVTAWAFALRSLGIAAVVSAILLAVPVWYMVAGPQRIKGPVWSGLHAFFVARVYQLWNPGPYRTVLFPGTLQGPQLPLVGFGVLAVAGVAVIAGRRRPALWVMAVIAVVSTLLSWGGILWLSPDHIILSRWLPWSWFTRLPILYDISAIHFSALADLAVAVVVAVGLDALRWSPSLRRVPRAMWVVGAVGVAAATLVPLWSTYQAPLTVQPIELPPWYATAALEVPAGSVVVNYPFPASAALSAEPMVWQAADGMHFRLAGGYVKVPGPGRGVIGTGAPGSAVSTLVGITLDSGAATVGLSARQLVNLRAALHQWRTSYIVVTDTGGAPSEAAALFTAATGRIPVISHRAWVWDLRDRPLGGSYDAAAAALAFTGCRSPTTRLGVVPEGQPLSQAYNECVSVGTSGADPPAS